MQVITLHFLEKTIWVLKLNMLLILLVMVVVLGAKKIGKLLLKIDQKKNHSFFGLLLMMHTEIGRLTIQGYHLILIVYMLLRCFMMDQSLVASLRPTTMRFVGWLIM